jgi:hypothetical protein
VQARRVRSEAKGVVRGAAERSKGSPALPGATRQLSSCVAYRAVGIPEPARKLCMKNF